MSNTFLNPFRPGAGQPPPYLAGREKEKEAFEKLLAQDVVIKNMILTGLRGTGKTALLETLKPVALANKWLWAGADLSESASVSENAIAIRLLTDLSVVTSQLLKGTKEKAGFSSGEEKVSIDYASLVQYYTSQPGLVSDKLKATLEYIWSYIKDAPSIKGIVFAYDEAQNMSDSAKDKEYPLSVLLEVFQSLQRKNYPFLLVLVGLPTLFPKLVDARTYSERMFNVIELKSLSPSDSKDAIVKPTQKSGCPVTFDDNSVTLITKESGGYPYFIQFVCRETFDSWIAQIAQNIEKPSVPLTEIVAKLDTEFFAARWNRASDRERELLSVIASLENCQEEFTIKEVAEQSKKVSEKPITDNQINQMFVNLASDGFIYRTRYGKYTFGIPLLGEYIKRQEIL
ncbi:MAG: ATP-binding protein [Minisyncoccia bacterium]